MMTEVGAVIETRTHGAVTDVVGTREMPAMGAQRPQWVRQLLGHGRAIWTMWQELMS